MTKDIKYPEDVRDEHIIRRLRRERHMTARALYKMTGTLRVKCCICGASMGSKPCLPENYGKVSHGYCEECLEQQMRDLDALDCEG